MVCKKNMKFVQSLQKYIIKNNLEILLSYLEAFQPILCKLQMNKYLRFKYKRLSSCIPYNTS